jgi:hypothetical protein
MSAIHCIRNRLFGGRCANLGPTGNQLCLPFKLAMWNEDKKKLDGRYLDGAMAGS